MCNIYNSEISEGKGIIFNIQRYSLHDGPGGRTTIFIKGCPLRCSWCQNPESWELSPTIIRYDKKCISCGYCVEVCPTGAIIIDESVGRQIDYSRCIQCLECARKCPTGALTICGKYMSVEEVVSVIKRDKIFYDNSGGGVTISGGEPTIQPEFVKSVLRECKKSGIHTALDTSGYASYDILKSILEWTDLVLYDIKHVDPERHQSGTGLKNELILTNIANVSKKVETWVRVPVISNYNTSEEFFNWLGKFCQKIGISRVSLLPYHEWGKQKFDQLGLQHVNRWNAPNAEALEKCGEICRGYGLQITYGR